VSVYLPANWVAAGHGLPDACSAHGRPVTARKRTRIESTPPGWVWALLPLGLLIFLVVRAATRKAIFAAGWGFCASCVLTRRAWMGAGFGLLAAAVLTFFAASQVDPAGSGPMTLVGVSIALVVLGYVALRLSAGEVIARARLTRDGWYVEVRHPAPAFEHQAHAALAQAAQIPRPGR
jgi:hypothetical protein